MSDHLTQLTTNVKGPTRTIHLGPRVVIVGDGGKGKSAIGQSVSLLAGGYADGVDGRNDVKGDRLSRLSAPEPLAVEGIVGGQSVSFRLRDGIKRPENRTPAKQVRAALQAGDDAARKAFLRWAAGDVSDTFVISLVADDLKDLFRRLWTTRQADNAIDRLLAVADFARKTKADRMKEAKGAQKIVDEIQAPPSRRRSRMSTTLARCCGRGNRRRETTPTTGSRLLPSANGQSPSKTSPPSTRRWRSRRRTLTVIGGCCGSTWTR